jgi:hypothetical protein
MDQGKSLKYNPSEADIERYFSGKMSEEERTVLEKAAEEDPFLKEALEGLSMIHSEELIPAVNDINSRIKVASGEPGRKGLAVWYAAAAVAVLITASAVMISKLNSLRVNQTIAAESVPVPQQTEVISSDGRVAPEPDSAQSVFPGIRTYRWEDSNIKIQRSFPGSDREIQESVNGGKIEESVAEDVEAEPAAEMVEDEKYQVAPVAAPVPETSPDTVAVKDFQKPVKKESARKVAAWYETDKKTAAGNQDKPATFKRMLDEVEKLSENEIDISADKPDNKKGKSKSIKDCLTCPDKTSSATDALNYEYAFKKFSEGNYKAAAEYFDEYLKNNQNDKAVLFNALSNLYISENKKASELLSNLKASGLYPQTTEWLETYLMLIEKDTDIYLKGKRNLERIQKKSGLYAAPASVWLGF